MGLPTYRGTLETYAPIGTPLTPRAPEAALTITHHAEVFRLADSARLLTQPELAVGRMATPLRLHGDE
jgi:hypothetical protein